MVSPISFDLAMLSASILSMQDASGLAPLELPPFFGKTCRFGESADKGMSSVPSGDAIQRFQSAMMDPEPVIDVMRPCVESLSQQRSMTAQPALNITAENSPSPDSHETDKAARPIASVFVDAPISYAPSGAVLRHDEPTVVEAPVSRAPVEVVAPHDDPVVAEAPRKPETVEATPLHEPVAVEAPVLRAPVEVVAPHEPVAVEAPHKPVTVEVTPSREPVVVEAPVTRAPAEVAASREPVVVKTPHKPVPVEATPPREPVVVEAPITRAPVEVVASREPVAVEAPNKPVTVEIMPSHEPVVVEAPVLRAPVEVVAPREPVAVEAPHKPEMVEAAPSREPVAVEAPHKPVPVEAAPPREPVAVEVPVSRAPVEVVAPREPVAVEASRETVSFAVDDEETVTQTAVKPESQHADAAKVPVVVDVVNAGAAANLQSLDVSQSVEAASAARSASAAMAVDEIVKAVSAQIEVVPSLVKGEGEVVIHLKPTVLDGSEMRLSAKDGVLSLEMTPATPEAAQVIVRNVPQLERALAEHIPAFHGFSVAVKKGKFDENK